MCCSAFTAKFIYVCLEILVLFLFSFLFHLNFHFHGKFLYVLFSFHSKIYKCVLFGESPGPHPGGIHSHFPSSHFVQFTCAQCGDPGEVSAPGRHPSNYQATQTQFSGAFHYSSHPYFSNYISLPYFYKLSQIKTCQAPCKIKCHRKTYCVGLNSDRKAC